MTDPTRGNRHPEPNVSGLERFVPRVLDTWDVDAPGRSWQIVDGTLCFVDISGFTALSERLARKGRVGAEELIGVLNRVFAAMLDVAYRRGGSLIKFGGDALFLLFDRDDHALQATSAAVELRRTLREASAATSTSVGRLHLRMSVGLETGPVHLFRVGGLHKELLIAGPTATTVSRMEEMAEAGQIVIGPGTRSRLPTGSVMRSRDDGFLLPWRRVRVEPSGPVHRAGADPATIEDCVPVALRELLASGRVEHEHRTAVVTFIEFRGLDHHLATEGPEVAGALVDEVVSAAMEEAREEGVTFLATDLGKDGGKILLSAGAPVTQEDDEGRMLRACCRILERDLGLTRRIGVNRGHVFTGEVGTRFRSTYVAMGDTTNLAARMMAAAPPGGLYVAPSVVSRARSRFETTVVPPFAAKGKSEPVRALAVGSELGPRNDDPDRELPLVGRRGEMARLRTLLRANLDGDSGVAVLTGDRGMGKTRLVREALTELGGVPSFVVQADPYAVASPYRAFRDTARRLLGIRRGTNREMAAQLLATVGATAPDLLALAPLLGDVTHVEVEQTTETARIEPRFRADRLADVVVELLARALPGQMVLVVEDAHWMDDASRALLERMERASFRHPWAMVVTRREQAGGYVPADSRGIELGPIDDDDMTAALDAATPSVPLRPDDARRVAARLGGNPLFLLEVARAIEEHGDLVDVPDSVEEVVSARVDELPPLPRHVLRTASVLGRSFRPDHLEGVLDDVVLDEATRFALEDFLEADGEDRLRFRHALMRDALYARLSFRRRRELHLAAGRVIEAGAQGEADSLAHLLDLHYLEGHDHRRAYRFARVAGDAAAGRFANLDAAEHYERALAASRQLGLTEAEVAEVWRSLGDVLRLAGRYGPAGDAYIQAHRRLHNGLARAEVQLVRAETLAQAGSYRAALAMLTRARRSLMGEEDPAARRVDARLAAFTATTRIYQQRPDQALEAAIEAIELARAADEPAALATAMQRHDIAWFIQGRFDQACYLDQAAEIFGELGDLASLASVTSVLGGKAFLLGDWARAIELYEETQVTDAMTGNEAGSASAAANLAEVLVQQRRFERAIDLLSSARRTALASDYGDLLPFVGLNLGRALAGAGRLDEAAEALRETIEESEDIGQTMSAAEARLALVAVLAEHGEVAMARQVLAEVPGDHRARFAAADVLAQFRCRLAEGGSGAAPRLAEVLVEEIERIRPEVADYELVPLLLLVIEMSEDAGPRARAEAELAVLAERYAIDLGPMVV